MKKLLFAVVGSLLLAAGPTRAGDARAIDKQVSALVALLGDGVAIGYPRFRLVRFGNLFDGEAEDAVALFSIEGFGGSNYHAEYLAVFAAVPEYRGGGRATRPYRLAAVAKIGGRGWRTFDWKSVRLSPGRVTLSGHRWGGRDPACCASEAIEVRLRVDEELILEEGREPVPVQDD